jgi:hypothetical protein
MGGMTTPAREFPSPSEPSWSTAALVLAASWVFGVWVYAAWPPYRMTAGEAAMRSAWVLALGLAGWFAYSAVARGRPRVLLGFVLLAAISTSASETLAPPRVWLGMGLFFLVAGALAGLVGLLIDRPPAGGSGVGPRNPDTSDPDDPAPGA